MGGSISFLFVVGGCIFIHGLYITINKYFPLTFTRKPGLKQILTHRCFIPTLKLVSPSRMNISFTDIVPTKDKGTAGFQYYEDSTDWSTSSVRLANISVPM